MLEPSSLRSGYLQLMRKYNLGFTMNWFASRRRPLLSIIVLFFNMTREAPRTLYSLSRAYQKDIGSLRYEVIAIDNGSQKPLNPKKVKQFGSEFCYRYFDGKSQSPVAAINDAAEQARGTFLMICIDGARILSPRVLHYAHIAVNAIKYPFVYTLSWHLGPSIQNKSILDGYNQTVEDFLLKDSHWRLDGYRLFDISSLAGSCAGGFFSDIAESNCFMLPRSIFLKMGGMEKRFQSPGGGLVNLDFFRLALKNPSLTPVCLLGEGNFHQIHGGVATNVPLNQHPMEIFQKEYYEIRKSRWECPKNQKPLYLGCMHQKALRFVFQLSNKDNT